MYNAFVQLREFLERRGHRATIVAPEDFPGLRGRHARWFPLVYPLWIARWLATAAGNYDLAVFHSYSGWLVHLLRRCVPAYRGIRLVTTFHGLEPIYYARLHQEAESTLHPLRLRFRLLHGGLMPRLLRIGCRQSDRVLCLNTEEVGYLKRNRWALPTKVSVVSNGVPRSFFVDHLHAPRVRRLLFVGQWREMKGIRYLVQAFELLASQSPELELRCVGTLATSADVQAHFPVSLRSRVSVLPQAPREELVSEYRNADIFVFPSLSEGFSSALAEAMAAGLPIVATPVGAAPDLLAAEVNSLLVPIRDSVKLAEAIFRLMSDQSLRERLGRQAQVAAAAYELDRVHAGIESILEQTVNSAL